MRDLNHPKIDQNPREFQVWPGYRSSFFVSRLLHLGMNRDGRIDCGVIIGNIDGNLVRYLEFHDNDDPVVTITGSGTTSIKSQLESQF